MRDNVSTPLYSRWYRLLLTGDLFFKGDLKGGRASSPYYLLYYHLQILMAQGGKKVSLLSIRVSFRDLGGYSSNRSPF